MRKTTGISLMLLIFLSLSLITFSLLSLSGATADRKLSQKGADRTTQYYLAESQAHTVLQEIDEHLALILKDTVTASPDDTFESVWDARCRTLPKLLKESNPDLMIQIIETDSDDAVSLTFEIPITDSQVLHAELALPYPAKADDPLYIITCWRVINTQDWTPDTSQNLYRTN